MHRLRLLNKDCESRRIDFQEGVVILVDKPLEWTSFDIVNKIRFKLKYAYNYKKIKVGHAGTLDPLATGLLIVCTGKYTKKINDLQETDKEYTGIIKLGATTPTYDTESEEDTTYPIDHIDENMIEVIRKSFLGHQWQIPPIYSAIKIKGEAAYKLARRGDKIKMKKRPIRIDHLELNRISPDKITFTVSCTKGTYIRSLAHDIGKKLGSGAYLTKLRRSKIGEYHVKNALTITDIEKYLDLLGSNY